MCQGKKKKTRNDKNKTTRQGFSVLHEPVKTQRKRLLCSQKKKRKGLHVTNFLHMFAEAPSLKTHSFFTLIFQGLPYDLKIFCLYQNKVIWMSMPNVSFQKKVKKKTRNKMISKKGEVSFFLNCALVKNSLKKEEKKKPSL